jgi:hypothetical protein
MAKTIDEIINKNLIRNKFYILQSRPITTL